MLWSQALPLLALSVRLSPRVQVREAGRGLGEHQPVPQCHSSPWEQLVAGSSIASVALQQLTGTTYSHSVQPIPSPRPPVSSEGANTTFFILFSSLPLCVFLKAGLTLRAPGTFSSVLFWGSSCVLLAQTGSSSQHRLLKQHSQITPRQRDAPADGGLAG